MSKKVIYILTNPSFPNYVKIGYADDVERRLSELNRSECTPFAFRIYATYEVDRRLMDLKLHALIDKLNPNLRSIDVVNGQKRVREFYAMSKEDAYSIFEAVAEINNCTERLKLWETSEQDRKAEELAEEIEEEKKSRMSNYTFDYWRIPVGSVLEYIDDPSVTCVVATQRKVEYNGETMYMTNFARKITGNNSIVHGPGWVSCHFKYNGEPIIEIENRLYKK